MKKTVTRRHMLQTGSVAAGAVGINNCRPALLQSVAQFFTPTRTLLTHPVRVPADFVGMHFHRWPAGNPPSPAPTYGYGSVRSHDYSGPPHGTDWYSIHLGPNLFDWTALDLWVSTHAAKKKTLIYCVYGTPEWVTSSKEHRDPYGKVGGSHPPRDLQPLNDFVHALVSRYNARQTQIQFIEIWNEPHFEQQNAEFWWGTAEDLARMAKVIYQAAKGADPHIRVLTPGFIRSINNTLTGSLTASSSSPSDAQNSSLYQYLAASDGAGSTASRWCDGVAYHIYSERIISPTQGVEGAALMLRKLLTLMNLRIPIYITECGFFPKSDFGMMSLSDKATRLRRLAVVVAGVGVSALYFYSHDDEFIGNPSKNPEIATAIGEIHSRIAGKTLNQITIVPGGAYQIRTDQEEFSW